MATVTEHQDLTGSLTLNGEIFTCASGDGGAFWVRGGGSLNGFATFSGNETTATNGDGGAIFNQGTITLDSTLFENNSASIGVAPNGRGGAICNAGNSTVTLTNTTFTNNTARIGGAIYNAGTLNLENVDFTTASDSIYNEGALVTRGTINAANTSLTTTKSFDNYAVLTLGELNASNSSLAAGGVMWNGGSANIASGILSNNVATMGGGAFWNHTAGATLDIGAVSFINNAAINGETMVNGGAVYNQNGAAANFDGSVFTGNTAANGGAIYTADGTVSVANSHFSGNGVVAALNYDGGAIYSVRSTLSISGSTYTGNTAGGRGGAVCVDAGTLTLSGSEFYGNSADQGGALANNSTATVSNLYFSGNAAATAGGAIYNTGTIDITGATFATETDTIYNTGKIVFSGDIDASATTLTTTKTFDNNGNLTVGVFEAENITGAGGAGAIWNGGTVTLLAGKIANTSYSDAGAIRNHYETSVANIGAVLMENNSAGNDGGAVYNKGTVNLTGTTFSGNEAGRGGAIYNEGKLNIDGATFTTASDTVYNSAANGALVFSGEVDMSATTLITKANFDIAKNATLTLGTIDADYGADLGSAYGVIFNDDNAVLNLNDGIVSVNNRYGTGHGAIRNHAATAVANIGKVLFTNNYTGTSGECDGEYGGAIYNAGTMNLTGTTFSGNEAGRGGAIYNQGTVNIDGATFATATDNIFNYGTVNFINGTVDMSATSITSHNRISNDGSIFVAGEFNSSGATTFGGGGGFYNGSVTTINGGTFYNNSAALGGGAIYNARNAELVLNAMIFANNSAPAGAYGGGAIYADENGSMTVSGCTFAYNSVTGDGGAIYNYGDLEISNTLFYANTATGNGGALLGFSSGNTIDISGSTFATASDTIYTNGTVNFADRNIINASISGSGIFNVNNAELIFNNSETITVAALAFSGMENTISVNGSEVGFSEFIFNSGSQVNFNSLDLSDVMLTVDGTGLGAGAVIATGVTAIGAYTISNKSNIYFGLAVVDNDLVLKEIDAQITAGSDFESYTGNGVTVMDGGKVGTLFADKSGAKNITTTILGGKVESNLVGGAYVAAGNTAAVNKVELLIGGTAGFADGSRAYAGGYLYGNAEDAEAAAEAQLTVKSVNITIDGGAVSGNLYGGAHARQFGNASVTEVNITVTAGSHGRIYAGGWAEKGAVSSVGTSTVIISGGTVDYLYGGGANADGTTTVGTTTITIENDAVVNTIFMSGRYGYSSVSGTVTLNYNSTTGMKRLSGVSSAGVDNANNTVVNVLSDLTADLIDYVDKFVISEDCKLTANDAFYLGNRTATGETDGFTIFDFSTDGLDKEWTAVAGISDFTNARFSINGSEAQLWDGESALAIGDYKLSYNKEEKLITLAQA